MNLIKDLDEPNRTTICVKTGATVHLQEYGLARHGDIHRTSQGTLVLRATSEELPITDATHTAKVEHVFTGKPYDTIVIYNVRNPESGDHLDD